MKTDIFNSINSKLTPDQSVITELLRKVENNELPEEPVIETDQAPVELISESSVIREPAETEAEPKIKVKSKVLPFVAVAAALVLVCTGGFFLLRGSDLRTAPGTSDSASEKDMEQLKEANSNAKLLFTVVNNSIADLIADGNEVSVQEYKNSDNYGKVISLNELTEQWNGKIIDVYGAEYIDYCICSAFRDSGADKGYIYFELDDEDNVIAAQWAESTGEGIVGQYPYPESEPSAVHKIGQIYYGNYFVPIDSETNDTIWGGLEVSLDTTKITEEGVTVDIGRTTALPDGYVQYVESVSLSLVDGINDNTYNGVGLKDDYFYINEETSELTLTWRQLGALELQNGKPYDLDLHITAKEDTEDPEGYFDNRLFTLSFTYQMSRVPDVVGMTKEEAELTIADAGFNPVFRDIWVKEVEEGLIVKQQPEADEELSAGEEVVLFVSAGSVETSVKVPDVRDMTEEEAVDLIKENKLTPVVEYVQHSDSTSGRVVVQSPAAGTYLDKNSEVKLQISKGVGDLPDNWGITMKADYVTENALSLYFTSDGSAADCEITTDTSYVLYKKDGDSFEECQMIGDPYWNAIAMIIDTSENAESKMPIEWSELYGKLQPGTYRIEKTLWLSSGLDGETDSREQTFGCVFTVE